MIDYKYHTLELALYLDIFHYLIKLVLAFLFLFFSFLCDDYDEVIVIGEWLLHDDSIEQYVSIELIFGDQSDEGLPIDDDQILKFMMDYANNHELIINSYSDIYRDPFERASVNVIFQKNKNILKNRVLKNHYSFSSSNGNG